VKPLPTVSPFERTLSRLMLAGVWLSALLLTMGLTLLLAFTQSSPGDLLLRAGLLMLMTTPVLRIALSIIEATRQRDWFWLWSTIAVVAVLTGTVFYSWRTSA
jgi:uncharacterized membrane protein